MQKERDSNRVLTRRKLLKQIPVGILAGTTLAKLAIPPSQVVGQSVVPPDELPVLPKEIDNEDVLIRMTRELRKALTKPVAERKWMMAIDVRKCVGCYACTISCIAENKLPCGVVYRPVIEEQKGSYPNLSRQFWPRPCFHCENPSCTPVCPVKATYKQADGVVVVDYDKCIGCRYCITACPYSARYSDFGESYTTPLQPYETLPSSEYGKKWHRKKGKSPIGNARKCHFCLHLITQGMLPRCVSTCIGRATYFGDANDKTSLIHKLNQKTNIVRLKEELGTKPNVFYLV